MSVRKSGRSSVSFIASVVGLASNRAPVVEFRPDGLDGRREREAGETSAQDGGPEQRLDFGRHGSRAGKDDRRPTQFASQGRTDDKIIVATAVVLGNGAVTGSGARTPAPGRVARRSGGRGRAQTPAPGRATVLGT